MVQTVLTGQDMHNRAAFPIRGGGKHKGGCLPFHQETPALTRREPETGKILLACGLRHFSGKVVFFFLDAFTKLEAIETGQLGASFSTILRTRLSPSCTQTCSSSTTSS